MKTSFLLLCIISSLMSCLGAYAKGNEILCKGICRVDSCLKEKQDCIKDIETFEFLAFLHYAFNRNNILDYDTEEAYVRISPYERFKADYWQNSAAYDAKVDSVVSSIFIFHSIEELGAQNKNIWNERGALFLLHKLDGTLEQNVFDFHKIIGKYLHR